MLSLNVNLVVVVVPDPFSWADGRVKGLGVVIIADIGLLCRWCLSKGGIRYGFIAVGVVVIVYKLVVLTGSRSIWLMLLLRLLLLRDTICLAGTEVAVGRSGGRHHGVDSIDGILKGGHYKRRGCVDGRGRDRGQVGSRPQLRLGLLRHEAGAWGMYDLGGGRSRSPVRVRRQMERHGMRKKS